MIYFNIAKILHNFRWQLSGGRDYKLVISDTKKARLYSATITMAISGNDISTIPGNYQGSAI